MSILQIYMQSDGKVLEVLPEELEKAELAVEDLVCQILVELFDGGSVEDVSIHFSPHVLSHRICSIQVDAQCSSQAFTLVPRTSENMELALESRLHAVMKELVGPLKVDCIISNPSSWKYQDNFLRPRRQPK